MNGCSAATCYHIQGLSVLSGHKLSHKRALYSINVKHGCRFSYQKKILERRLAVADGLSFVSFRRGSIPPNSKSNLKTFSAGFVAEGLSIKTYRGGLTERTAAVNSSVCQYHTFRHSGQSGLLQETVNRPVWLSGERSVA